MRGCAPMTKSMRAFVVTAPGVGEVMEVEAPIAGPGDVVIEVARVGVCGTDVEFFDGTMQYLHDGHAHFPMRLGHEWMGRVTTVGERVDPSWLGRRVTADTMLGCGECRRCLGGYQHVCEFRTEIGIRGGQPGALAEQIAVPARALHALPDAIDETMGALVEPGGNALRSVQGAQLAKGDRLLVLGAGTIGLLVAMFAKADGAEVHILGRSRESLDFAASLGFEHVCTEDDIPAVPFDAVIEASNAPSLPALAVDVVEPGKRVVFIGLSGTPSLVDTRMLALKDVTAVGVLSASPGLVGTIERFAAGTVDPRPLVAATVGLAETGAVLAGAAHLKPGRGPKVHVDPRR